MSGEAVTARRFGPGTVSRDAALSFVYNAVVRIGTAALSVVVARSIGPVGNGELGVALQVAAFGTLVTSFNIPQGLAQRLAGTPDAAGQARWLKSSARMVLVLAAIGAVVLALIARPLALAVFDDPALAPALLVCAPLVFATAAYLISESALQGFRQFGALARWGGAVTVMDLALVLPASRFGVAGVLAARALVRLGAVAASWLLWLGRRARHQAPVPDPAPAVGVADEPAAEVASRKNSALSIENSLLGFAGPTFLAAAATLASQLLLRTLLVRGAGLGETGQMQAADSVAQGLLLIPIATTAAFMPAVSRTLRSGHEAFSGIFSRALSQVTGLHLAACLTAMAIVPSAVPLVFGRDFDAARPVFIDLAAAYGLAGPSTVFAAALLGRGEVWSGAALNLIWGAVVLGVFSFGTGALGAQGAALAMAVGYLVMLIVCVVVFPARWKLGRAPLLGPVIGAPLLLAAGAALALRGGVLAAAGCLALALFAFWAWTLRVPGAATGARS